MTLLIARQPVFDNREQIFAYDLVVHGDAGSSGIHHDVSPEQILAEVFLDTGLEKIAGGHRVFVTTSRELLLRDTLRVLPVDRVILHVPSLAPSDTELIAACRDLISGGYRLAVDVDERTELAAPLSWVHVIRVDVIGTAGNSLTGLAERLRAYPARRLAVNVRHRGERDRCLALGFDLFEGYRFTAPEVVPSRDIGIEHLQAFRILKLLRDPRTNDREIEALIQRDVGLSYKLLRMVNSAAAGGRDLWSIGHALRLLGREHLARWLGVLLVSDLGTNGVRAELTRVALVRARMCEQFAILVGVPRAGGSLFLVGLLSMVDQLLETSMPALCDSLDLATDLRHALLHRSDFFGTALRLVESYVDGAWPEVETAATTLNLSPSVLQPLYLDALQWATSQRRETSR